MKIEALKKAQSRGWMEGGDVDMIAPYVNRSGILVLQVYFIEQDTIKYYTINDIIYATNFCDKYFDVHGEFIDGLECKYCVDTDLNITHQKAMLSMSQSDRIAFIDRHLEVKEDETEIKCRCNFLPAAHDIHSDGIIKANLQVNEIEDCQHDSITTVGESFNCNNCGRMAFGYASSFESDKRLARLEKQIKNLKLNQGGH